MVNIRIAVEGADGSGKTTVSELIFKRLQNITLSKHEKLSVVKMREPGGTAIGELVRNKILFPQHEGVGDQTPPDHYTMRLAFMISHSDVVYKLCNFERHASNSAVVLDRYSPISNMVYERYGDEKEISWMMAVYKKLQGIWAPDMAFVLTPADEYTERAVFERSQLDRANSNFMDAETHKFNRRLNGYREILTLKNNVTGVQTVEIPFYADSSSELIADIIFKKIVEYYKLPNQEGK